MDPAASFSRLSLQPTDQEHVLKEASDGSPNTHLQLREQEWLLEEVPEAGSLGFGGGGGGGGGGAEGVGSFGSEVKLSQNLEKCIWSKTQKLQEDHICQICKRGVHGQEEQPEGNCMELQAVVAREFSHHEPGVARLNNGSFGSPPQCVLSNQAMWAQQWLQHPDAFCWEPLEKGFAAARQQLADLIHSPSVNEIVLLENATTGAGVVALDVMWSFLERRYEKGDSILMFNSAYGAIKKVFEGYCFRAGARLFEYKMPFPVSSNQEILQTFEDALRREKKENPSKVIRLAVIDHIVSMPSIILPIRELIQLCRAYGVEQIFVDAAHAIGNVDVNVQEIDADYYVSNLHKWLFAPPVVAFFHCKPQHLSQLHHPLVSHNYGLGLVGESYWVGTRDYSAFLAVPAAIKFVNDTVGDIKSYRDYNHRKVVDMAQMLASAWGTHLGAPPELFGSMAMVGLPASLNIHSPEDALRMRTRLRTEFQVEVPLYYPAEGVNEIFSDHQHPTTKTSSVAYARISHQIYNKLEEYYMLRDAVQAIAAEST